jgi:hypothetical protein
MTAPHTYPSFAPQRSGSPDQVSEQQLLARMRAQLAVPHRHAATRVVDVAGQRRIVTFPSQPGRGPAYRNAYGPPRNQEPHRYPLSGQRYPGGPTASGYSWALRPAPAMDIHPARLPPDQPRRREPVASSQSSLPWHSA